MAHIPGLSNLGIPEKNLPEVYRFEVSPSEVTTDFGQLKNLHLHIVRNDDRGMVATGSQEFSDDNQSLQIIFTVGINKISGEFGLAFFAPTAEVQDWLGEKVTHGRCVKS